MKELLARGGTPLRGEVDLQGAKNSVLPILAATILVPGPVVLRRCPRLLDVEASRRILQALGCESDWQGEDLTVDASGMTGCVIPEDLMRSMRSSAIFLGAILARWGQAELSYPGGCELGPRPIDLHLAGLRAMGAEIQETGGVLRCRTRRLQGRQIVLDFPSVGATENLMLAGCGAEGTTVISNAAREPEIEDLQGFLNACGACVSGGGTSTVAIRGRRPLRSGAAYPIMPDRIVAASYLCAAAAAGGDVFLRGAREDHLAAVTAVLREAGCVIEGDAAGLRCRAAPRPAAPRPIRTAPYPGFPTDAQAVVMAALLRCRGAAVLEENLFTARYRHVDELRRMGASIRTSGRVAVVMGVDALHGAAVECTDLRGGAALCVAALSAEGESRIRQLHHIDRGYADLEGDLTALGADICRREIP